MGCGPHLASVVDNLFKGEGRVRHRRHVWLQITLTAEQSLIQWTTTPAVFR